MYAPHKLGTKGIVNRAVTRDPGKVPERVGADGDPEMAFPALLVARVAAMPFAFVHDREFVGREGRLKLFPYFFGNRHFFPAPSSIRAANDYTLDPESERCAHDQG